MEVSLIEANSYWRECMRHLTGSGGSGTLSSVERYSGLCAVVAYGRWGHLRCRTYIGAASSAEEKGGNPGADQ